MRMAQQHVGQLLVARLAVERAQSDIQAVGTQKAKAQLSLEKAELDDSFMVISAPFAGTIAARGLRVGDTAGRVRTAVGQIAPAFLLSGLALAQTRGEWQLSPVSETRRRALLPATVPLHWEDLMTQPAYLQALALLP